MLVRYYIPSLAHSSFHFISFRLSLSLSLSFSFRFPLSLSDAVYDLDKAGQPCTTFDCIFNLDVLKQAMANKRLKVFLIELALGWVQEKHHLILDSKYKLPRMKYKGKKREGEKRERERERLPSYFVFARDSHFQLHSFAVSFFLSFSLLLSLSLSLPPPHPTQNKNKNK